MNRGATKTWLSRFVPPVWVVACLMLLLLLVALPALGARGGPGSGGVSTESPAATRAAIAILKQGGNAVDAAVTAALMGGVTSPTSSGIGGGGFALVWDAKAKRAVVLDFRETAPAGIDPAPFERRPVSDAEVGVLVGTPGEVKGLFELHDRFGKLEWAKVVAPAQRAAEQGFRVHKHLAAMLAYAQKTLSKDPGISTVFYPGGKPAVFGRVLTNQKLAATLKRIAAEGPQALYEGVIAERLSEAVKARGGSLSMADLKAYKPVERAPIAVGFGENTVYTMPPPSAGGMMLAQTLRLFSAAELDKLGYQSGAYQHMLAEALRAAMADRMRYLGDPAFEKFDLEKLVSQKRMDVRRKSMALERTHAIPRFGLEEHGTHHLMTLDREGNMVALTTTVNRLFGAKFTSRDDGIVVNDELDDFTAKADVAPFGMKESPNRPRAGARPISSMTPTIVVNQKKQVVLGLGGSGGTAIATNVTQLLLARLVFDRTPEQAVADRRFYIPTEGPLILLEKGAARERVEDLERRGEVVGEMPYNGTAVQMIAVDGHGRALAAADPRKHGLGLTY